MAITNIKCTKEVEVVRTEEGTTEGEEEKEEKAEKEKGMANGGKRARDTPTKRLRRQGRKGWRKQRRFGRKVHRGRQGLRKGTRPTS